MADAPEFSLALSDDHVTLRDWVHEFAERVIRPAAEEWDEREETPWPIIEEAARAGIYTWEFFAELAGDPVGLSMPIANEELFWGDAGIAAVDPRDRPVRVGHRRAGDAPTRSPAGCRSATARQRHEARRVLRDRARRRVRRVVAADAGRP